MILEVKETVGGFKAFIKLARSYFNIQSAKILLLPSKCEIIFVTL